MHRDAIDTSPSRRRRIAVGGVILVAAAAVLVSPLLRRGASNSPTSATEVRPTPSLLVAVHRLGRLETVSYHLERVIEVTDQETKLFGFLKTKDAILLVAVGEVVAGVDLQGLEPNDIRADWVHKKVTLRLPAPEVFSVFLDNEKTHVYSRTTDSFASRSEDLEGRARVEAEHSMRDHALQGGVLTHAQKNAETQLSGLLYGIGFTEVTFDWR